MKMKNISLAVLLAAGFSMSAAQAAETGTLNFNGTVTTSSCAIDAASLTVPVDFGKVAISAVNGNAVGAVSSATQKAFTIKLNGCPAGLAARVQFNGTASGYTATKAFVGGMPRYAGIIIKNEAGVTATPNSMATTEAQTLVAGVNELNYTAGLTKTSGSVEAGAINASVTYVISYQ